VHDFGVLLVLLGFCLSLGFACHWVLLVTGFCLSLGFACRWVLLAAGFCLPLGFGSRLVLVATGFGSHWFWWTLGFVGRLAFAGYSLGSLLVWAGGFVLLTLGSGAGSCSYRTDLPDRGGFWDGSRDVRLDT